MPLLGACPPRPAPPAGRDDAPRRPSRRVSRVRRGVSRGPKLRVVPPRRRRGRRVTRARRAGASRWGKCRLGTDAPIARDAHDGPTRPSPVGAGAVCRTHRYRHAPRILSGLRVAAIISTNIEDPHRIPDSGRGVARKPLIWRVDRRGTFVVMACSGPPATSGGLVGCPRERKGGPVVARERPMPSYDRPNLAFDGERLYSGGSLFSRSDARMLRRSASPTHAPRHALVGARARRRHRQAARRSTRS